MISVVMAVYNDAKYLAEAIESILNQTYKDFEFIIVNDGSTDNSLDVINDYAQKDDRIKVIDLGENQGFCTALNRGIEIAQYEWIARMDSDDISVPDRFEKQMAFLADNPDIIVLGTYISHINAQGDILSVNAVGPTTRAEMQERIQKAHPVYVMHGTVLMKREIVEKVGGYNVTFVAGEDIELFARMVKHGTILAMPEALYLYRIHGSSMSMTRMFKQKRFTEYVELMYQCDLTGEPLPTIEEFWETQDKQPFFKRVRKRLNVTRALYYRRAGMAYGQKNWIKTFWYFGLASVIDPLYTIPRAWKQVFSRRH